MRHQLTNEEIASYRKNGFLIVDDFLSLEEVQYWKNTNDKGVADRQGQKFPHSEIKTGEADGINKDAEYFGKVFDKIVNYG